MQLPVLLYGNQILQEKAKAVDATYPGLQKLIADMWETMYGANGCGLAAPQVNVPIQVFVVDSKNTFKQMKPEERNKYFAGDTGIQETFINARITEKSGQTWVDQEGCLSLPAVWAIVERPWRITIEYLDARFKPREKTFSGLTARMIQHEFDHTQGILYIDYLPPLKRISLTHKLKRIMAGKVKPNYPVKY